MEVIKTNANKYIKLHKGNQTLVSSVEKATQFLNGEADQYITNHIRKSLRKNYTVERVKIDLLPNNPPAEQITEEQSQPQPIPQIQSKQSDTFTQSNIIPVITVDIDKAVDDFTDFIKVVDKNRETCETYLKHIESEICDLLHAAEFYKLNACDGCKIYKMLHDRRVERRKIKDMIQKYDIIKSSSLDDWKNGNVQHRIGNVEYREYKPRVLTKLFAKLENKERI